MSSTYSQKTSPARVRIPDSRDYHAIYDAIERQRISVREAPVSILCDTESAVDRIVSGKVDAYVLDEAYLICYSVGMPWYSKDLVLEELMVLRIGTGSKFSAITDLLDDIAELNDVSYIYVGGSFTSAPKALTRLYSSAGYKPEGKPSLVKRRQ